MARFSFTGKDSAGLAVTGHREAENATAVAQELFATGIQPVQIEPDEGVAKSQALNFSLGKKKVSIDELIIFSHQMSTLTRAGISVVRAVRGLAESARNLTFGDALNDIADNLEAGAEIAVSLARYPIMFSELYVSIIHVGENTGKLDEAFRRIAGYLEVERETRKRIKSATRYPSFVIGAIGIAMVILNVFVIPAFADVFAKFHAELPWQTQAILGVSNFFVEYWVLMIALTGAAFYGAREYKKTTAGRLRWDQWKLRLPLIGEIFEKINLGRFCQTFAMISRAGVPMSQGLRVVSRAVGNAYMANCIEQMRVAIERGTSISRAATETHLFTPVVLQMISVGEETGAMDELLEQAAGFYEEEVDFQLKGLTDAIEPILIIAIGIMVLVLALGVFLPLWDLSSVAKH